MNEFFKILNYLSYEKVPYSKLTEAEIKSINVYMLHRYLSMSSEYCIFANEVQAIPNLNAEQVYNIYLSLIPKSKKYFKVLFTKRHLVRLNKHPFPNHKINHKLD
jgi:hypothetical protein